MHTKMHLLGANTSRASVRQWLRDVLREPLFQFLLVGSALWWLVQWWHSDASIETVEVGSAERRKLARLYSGQFGREPTPQELATLIERYVREEIYWREGLALGLDREDEIVRRRVVQKYEFLQMDLASVEPPSDEALGRWYEQNRERYRIPGTVTFRHLHFSDDNTRDGGAKHRAMQALQALSEHPESQASEADHFPGLSEMSVASPSDVARVFGSSGLSQQVLTMPVGAWSGPYRSGYGWHLVWVESRTPPSLPTLSEIRDRLLADYREEQQEQMHERNFERLRAKYTVHVADES